MRKRIGQRKVEVDGRRRGGKRRRIEREGWEEEGWREDGGVIKTPLHSTRFVGATQLPNSPIAEKLTHFNIPNRQNLIA